MRIAILVFMSLVCSLTHAQKTVSDQLLENKLFVPYNNYFGGDCEWVYTHLNKSAFVQGDDVWFTSYVLNPANKRLNFATTKLYIELWSPEKKLVVRKILFVKAGTASHFIHLSDSLAPGSYCFRTYTSWMLNFYHANDLNTIITVLGNDKGSENRSVEKRNIGSPVQSVQKEKSTPTESRPDYDIQFLPESGNFLEGADNILGIKATDPNGKGVRISGTVFNSDKQEIISFSTNEYGIDKITVLCTSEQPYPVKITLPDGSTRDLMLPKPEPNGLILQVNSYMNKVVWFKLQTNESTRLLNKSYILLIHANGVIYNTYQISFSKENTIQFSMNKKDMGNGIVYATIFDENLTPVAERIFYNHNINTRGALAISTKPLAKDTFDVNVVIVDSLNVNPQFSKLSISVLPGESILNYFDNSLLSESILRPALRGNVENPNGYFEKYDVFHAVAIDNLLLTQGWRKYDWPILLKDTIHKFAYPFEEAFSVEGKVKNWLKNRPELKSKVTFLSPQNNIFLLAQVDSAGTFKLDRVYLADSTWIVASASSDKGKNWNRVLQIAIPEYSPGAPEVQQKFTASAKPLEISESIPQLTQGDILLQEVVIKAKKKEPFENNIYVGMLDRTFELTQENYNKFNNMEMLLQIQFNIRIERTQDGGYHINMGRGVTSFSGNAREPLMMIDEMKVTDPWEILNFPLELVEAVAVNKDGFGGGMEGSAGTIAIKSRTTPLFENNADATNIKKLIVKGYAAPSKYFEPKYVITPGSVSYSKYAAIIWNPELITDTTNKASFRFHVPKELKSINLRIEGISSEGKIFLHEQKMVLPGRD